MHENPVSSEEIIRSEEAGKLIRSDMRHLEMLYEIASDKLTMSEISPALAALKRIIKGG